MNQMRDVLGPLLTTQGFGFVLALAGATIGCASVIASGLSERSESKTVGELIALGICLAMLRWDSGSHSSLSKRLRSSFPARKEVFG